MTATSVMTVIDRLRAIELGEAKKSAASEPGTVRNPFGSNNVKYNTAFYGHEVSDPAGKQFAWCVVFQWWCMQAAGVPTSIFPKSAGVSFVRDWFDDPHRRRYFRVPTTPQVGDLVIFKYSHIGFVESVDPTFVVTVEGNSSNRVRRVQHRRDEAEIDGYCRPAYDHVQVQAQGGLSMADVNDILAKLELLRVGERKGTAADPHDFASLEGVGMKVDAARAEIDWLMAAVKAIAAKVGAQLPPPPQ
ncbi:MAG TPA: CHAP domain-containing protein [Actinomycetota bacterium]